MSSSSRITRADYEKTLKPIPEPIGPGELLLHEFLIPLGISQSRFAEAIGVPPAYINDIIKGRRGVTAEMAIRFEVALGMSARLWLNAQTAVDLWRVQHNKSAVAKRKKIAHLRTT